MLKSVPDKKAKIVKLLYRDILNLISQKNVTCHLTFHYINRWTLCFWNSFHALDAFELRELYSHHV